MVGVLRHRRLGRLGRKDLLDKMRTIGTGTEIEITTDRLRLRRVRRENISRQTMDERNASETVRLNRSF